MKAIVTVDKVGRLVLPKAIREAIGVSGCMTVNVEVVGNAARITVPAPTVRAMARKRGRAVFTGPLPEDWDSAEAVRRTRVQRLRR
jgi:bifunctional DNA-binding transcriptional regulator/antitoxin component of YhaV-PrlF toxin-antitoxin module